VALLLNGRRDRHFIEDNELLLQAVDKALDGIAQATK